MEREDAEGEENGGDSKSSNQIKKEAKKKEKNLEVGTKNKGGEMDVYDDVN